MTTEQSQKRAGTFVSNKEKEVPTHYCWLCHKVFIMDNQYGRQETCLTPACGGILLAYFDPL